MKNLIIAIAACTLLTGCANFNPAQLHNAYQKTKDSYAFCKDAYIQIKDDYHSVSKDFKAASKEAIDEFKSIKDHKYLNDWIDAE